jgi:hypothetical protein
VVKNEYVIYGKKPDCPIYEKLNEIAQVPYTLTLVLMGSEKNIPAQPLSLR